MKSQRYYHSNHSHGTIYVSSHPTYNTDSEVTSSSHMVVTLASVYPVIHTNMPPSYNTINSIPHLYVYGLNNSVVNILGGTDGLRHGRDNEFNKEVDIIID